MLTEEQIKNNRERFLEIINSIKVEGANLPSLTKWLDNSDFFFAPASTKYHCSYAGGLCQHSLNVYNVLTRLAKEFKDETGYEIPEDSIKITALMHDMAKVNFYESYLKNVKNEETGQWEKVPEYRVKDAADRFILGNHEQNSEYIAHTFFPLTVEESSAILHHHAGTGWDSAKDECPAIFNKYALATLLHTADFIATFLYERD